MGIVNKDRKWYSYSFKITLPKCLFLSVRRWPIKKNPCLCDKHRSCICWLYDTGEEKREHYLYLTLFRKLESKVPSSILNFFNILSEFYFRAFSNKTKDCVSTFVYWGVNFAFQSCNWVKSSPRDSLARGQRLLINKYLESLFRSI